LSFNQPKFSPTATWNSNGITSAYQSIVGEYPTGIFMNTNNTIYIANKEENTIIMWQEESVNATQITSGNFTQPSSLFVTSNGDIYIDDAVKNGRVQKWITETNIFVTVMNVNSSCYGLFVDINNTLYCSMSKYHQVVKRSLSNSTMNTNCVAAGTGSLGSDSNQLNGPLGIFIDVNLDLYVADCDNDRVQLFQSGESNGITVAGYTLQNPTITLDCPSGIILDAEKYLFIVDQNNHRIVVSSMNGFRCLVGCYGQGSQSNQLNNPFSLSFDRSGNMFVSDQSNHRIQKFLLMKDSLALSFNQPKFCPTATWNSNGITFANQSIVGREPTVIFMNTNNTIYVANRENSTILMWQEENINPTKIISGSFTEPRSLFVASNGDIYIDDGEKNGRVQKWMVETNTFITVMNVNSSCWGLFIDINDTLYCSMFGNHQVVKRSLNDSVMNSNCVAAGTADCLNHRIQLFQLGESNGITVAGYTSRNPTIELSRPSGVILDAEKYLFIADSGNNRIIGSDKNGFRCLAGCYREGSQPNQLYHPFSFSFDRSGNIFVTDQWNHRIQKFQYFEESCVNISSAFQTVYTSELTTNSSTYLRLCSSSSSYYEAIQVNVRRSGLYTFFSKSNMFTYGYIYEDDFNLYNPFENQLVFSDGKCNPRQFGFTIDLDTSITYILVVTTSYPNITGAFLIFASGPSNVDLKNIKVSSTQTTTLNPSNNRIL
ncbi:unnamed protein product, partial [Adineta steineri]